MQNQELETEFDALDAFRLEDVLFCPEALDAFLSGQFDGARENDECLGNRAA
jgi:hypothetical protein